MISASIILETTRKEAYESQHYFILIFTENLVLTPVSDIKIPRVDCSRMGSYLVHHFEISRDRQAWSD